MPPTSALTLLPPTPPVSTPIANYTSTPDTSFQDTFQSAQDRQLKSTKDASTTPSIDDQKTKPDKTSKKSTRSAKAKKAGGQDGSDESTDAIAEDPDYAQPAGEKADAPVSKDNTQKSPDAPAKKAVTVKSAPEAVSATPTQAGDNAQTSPTDPQKSGDGLLPRKPAVVKPVDAKAADPDNADNPAAGKSAADSSTDPSTTNAVATAATPTTTVKPQGFGDAQVNPSTTSQNSNPHAAAHVQSAQTSDAPPDAAAASQAAIDTLPTTESTDANPKDATLPSDTQALANFDQQLQRALTPEPAKADTPVPPTAQPQFAEANHSSIVTGVHTQLLPNGGSMQIRLDPPELGALQVTVQMRNGVMSASFETSSDQASRMLSHSLSQLKTALESTGVTVEKMHVQQAPKQDSQPKGEDSHQQHQDPDQQQQARQEQQRKQMLQKMWSKLSGIEDPLDLVA